MNLIGRRFPEVIKGSIALASLLYSTNSISKNKDPDQWTVKQILDRASEQSPQLKAIENKIEASRFREDQAELWDNPELAAQIGRVRSGGSSGSSFDVSIKQSLPLFGQKSAARKVAESQREVALSEKDKEALRIRHEVVRLSFKLAMFDELVEHVEHRQKKWDMVVKFLKSRTLASPSQILEKSLIQNRLREIEEKALNIDLEREDAWQALNVFLGLDKRIKPKVDWLRKKPETLSTESLSIDRNLELAQQAKNIQLAESEVRTSESKAYPDLKLGAGISRSRSDSEEQSVYSILELSVPIFDRGQASTGAARSIVNSEKNILEQKRREVSSEFAKSTLLLANAQKKIRIFPLSLIDQLEKEMDKTENAFRKSLIAAPSFLDLEEQVHEQTAKVYEAHLEYVQAMSNLLMISGKDFQTGVN